MNTHPRFSIRHLGTLANLGLLAAATNASAEPSLTIYNQNFAVVRDTVPLDLKAGVNEARFSGMTAQAETDSVILRDPAGKVTFQILEQAYRNDPVSSGLMLQLNEGKTIDFFIREPNKPDRTVQGKIVRSGYNPGGRPATQPIIEVDKKLQFCCPASRSFPRSATTPSSTRPCRGRSTPPSPPSSTPNSPTSPAA